MSERTAPDLPMVQRMSYADYHALPGVRWSHLSKIRDGSELHLREYLDRPSTPDTDSQRKGRLGHSLLFEPHRFAEDYVVFPGRRQGKVWEAFEEANADKCILRPDDVALGEGMANALRSNEHSAPYLRAGIPEGTIVWTDEATGIACKARPDWLTLADTGHGIVLVDVKTARTIEERLFGLAANRFGYHAQLAHYRRGLRTLGVQVDRVLILAVENTPPHDVGVFILDDAALTLGDAIVTETLGRYSMAVQRNKWPGRFASAVPLALPDYLFGDFDSAD